MTQEIVGLLFLVLALILFVILIFLYKITIAIGRLDGRLERLAFHLRDLNLYDMQPPELGILAGQTDPESGAGLTGRTTASGTDPLSDASLPPSGSGEHTDPDTDAPR